MSSSPDPARGGTGPLGRSRATWLAAAGVVVLLVVVLLVWSLNRGDDETSSTATSDPGSTGTSTASPSPGGSTSTPGTGSTGSGGGSGGSSGGSGGGSTGGPVNPAKPQQVRFDQTGVPAKGVDLDVVKVEKVQGKAQLPGEVSGPSLRITVRVQNGTGKAVSIDNVVSNLYYGPDRRPATPMLEPGSKAFPSTVKAGGDASGVQVFNVPTAGRDKLVLEMILDAKLRTVEFDGACPDDC